MFPIEPNLSPFTMYHELFRFPTLSATDKPEVIDESSPCFNISFFPPDTISLALIKIDLVLLVGSEDFS